MALNLSTSTIGPSMPPTTSLSAFPPAISPDLEFCDTWFGKPSNLQLHDCQTAWNNLPVHEGQVRYRPLRRSLKDPPSLLLTESHGTCELRFHASGKWVEENDFALDISPNKIRDMFGLLIERCVGEKGVGGMMTDGISRTIDWLLDEDTEFPGEPAKVAGNPRKLHIPLSATFFTAMIWHTRPSARQFEPGANHPLSSILLEEDLEDVATELRISDPDSALARELSHRAGFLADVWEDQYALTSPYWTWWGTERSVAVAGKGGAATGFSSAVENNDASTVVRLLRGSSDDNATTEGLRGGIEKDNVTFPGFDRLDDGNCTAASGGRPALKCSISRRRKRGRR